MQLWQLLYFQKTVSVCQKFCAVIQWVLLQHASDNLLLFHILDFSVLAFSNPAHLYFNFPYLYFPPVHILPLCTSLFHTCIFQQATCNFSAPTIYLYMYTCIGVGLARTKNNIGRNLFTSRPICGSALRSRIHHILFVFKA